MLATELKRFSFDRFDAHEGTPAFGTAAVLCRFHGSQAIDASVK